MDAVYVGYPSFDDLELNDAKIQTFSLTYKPIIILDEPKSGLCRGQMINMIDILQQMVPNEKIIIIVTHDYELIKNCKGKIIEFV